MPFRPSSAIYLPWLPSLASLLGICMVKKVPLSLAKTIFVFLKMLHILGQGFSKCLVQGGQEQRQSSLELLKGAHGRCFPGDIYTVCSHLCHRCHSVPLLWYLLGPHSLAALQPRFYVIIMSRGPNQCANIFCVILWNSAAMCQQDLGIFSERMK